MLIAFAVLVILVNVGVVLYIFSLFRSDAPFIRTPNQVLSEIIEALDLKPNDVVYDLGCGDGKVLFAAYKLQPEAKYIGIEVSFFPYALARIKKFFLRTKNITFVHGNFLNSEYGQATKVFTYLFPKIMEELWPKLQSQLKPGTKLVSSNFKPNSEPATVIELKNPSEIAKRLYIYNF